MTYKDGQLPRHTRTKSLFDECQIDGSKLDQVYAGLPERVDKYGTQSSAARDAALEAEIAALVTEIGKGLRQSDGDRWDAAQALHADQALECAAAIPKNTKFEAREPGLERRPWTADIRINDAERTLAVSFPNAQETRTAVVIAVLLGTLALAWIAGSQASSFIEPKLQPLGRIFGSKTQPTVVSPEATATRPVLDTGKITTSASVHGSALMDTQIQPRSVKTYPVTPQSTRSSEPRASEFGRRPKISTKPKPFPETRPTTIEGWTVRDVVDATAILEGPDGLWRAKPGDPVPGVGRVNSILRWGDRWIVATSGGLISSP